MTADQPETITQNDVTQVPQSLEPLRDRIKA